MDVITPEIARDIAVLALAINSSITIYRYFDEKTPRNGAMVAFNLLIFASLVL